MDAGKTMRLLMRCASVYAALMAFCAFGAASVPASVQTSFKPYFWLLGPPANLVYGTKFLPPFVVGTVVVAGLLFCVARARSSIVKGVCGVGLVMAWALFGFIVYAPGA